MTQTIKLRDIYSADLYTRSRASELHSYINKNTDEVVFDFDQIGFMSRSFTDELLNIIDDMPQMNFSFINRCNDLEAMMNKVNESRYQERKRGIGNAKMYEFNNMESLSKYLLAF